MESVFVSRRSVDSRSGESHEWRPHAGSSMQPSFNYHTGPNGQIFAGMTRVVWEVAEVVKGKGGTCLMPGSHKAGLGMLHFQASAVGTEARCSQIQAECNTGQSCARIGSWPPEGDESFDNGLWETYGCPPGSLIVFSEAVRHTGSAWTHADNARCAILMAYNHQSMRFHEPKPCMNADVIAGLTPTRQDFFKDVWMLGGEREVDPHVPR